MPNSLGHGRKRDTQEGGAFGCLREKKKGGEERALGTPMGRVGYWL